MNNITDVIILQEILEILRIPYAKYKRRFTDEMQIKSYLCFILEYIYEINCMEVGKILELHYTTVLHHRNKILDMYDMNIKYGYFEYEMVQIENTKKLLDSYIEFKTELN